MASAEKRGNGKRSWRARYQRPDGTYGSEPGFATKSAALNWGNDQEAAIRAGTWRDPRLGEMPLDEWWGEWIAAQNYSRETGEQLASIYRTHLQPWRGAKPIREMTMMDVTRFEKEKRSSGLSKNTCDNIMTLLRMLMEDAFDDQRIAVCPIQRRRQRRGTKNPEAEGRPRRPGAAISLRTFLAIALRLPDGGVAGAGLVVPAVVAAFTGMRWGEVVGMQRKYLMLIPGAGVRPASGWYIIDDDEGALHTPMSGEPYLGPPKGYIGRTVELPPFLVEILLRYLEWLPAQQSMLFLSHLGRPFLRDTAHDAWRRACDGWKGHPQNKRRAGRVDAAPLMLGLHWHDLRHTHKSWLVEDGIPAVARDERLGHGSSPDSRGGRPDGERGAMDSVYVHATDTMRARVLNGLQRRWVSGGAESLELEKLISRIFPSGSPQPVEDQAVASSAADWERH